MLKNSPITSICSWHDDLEMTSNQIKTVKMKFVWTMTPCGDICELWKAEHLSSVFAICVKNLTINLPNKTWHPLKTQDCEGHPTSGSHGCLVTIMKEFWRKRKTLLMIMKMVMVMMMMTKVQQAWPGYELVAPNLHGSTFGCCSAHLPFFLCVTFLASTFFVQFCTLGLAVWVVQNISKHPAASIFVYFLCIRFLALARTQLCRI